MAFVRALLVVTAVAVGFGLLFELILPAFGRVVAVLAIVCGAATWLYIPLSLVLRWNEKPRSSLASVGALIGMVFASACFSSVGLSFAFLTLIFMRGACWAWLVVAAILGFWVSGFTALVIFDHRKRVREARLRNASSH